MKPKRKFKPIRTLLLLLFIPTTLCCGYGYYVYNQSLVEEKIVLEQISKRTGLQPDWQTIREYVYCDVLKSGTSKENVEKGLLLVGQYYSPNEGSPIQRINFVDPATYYNLSPLTLIYNEEWELKASGAGEFNHGPRAYCEIERAKGQITLTP